MDVVPPAYSRSVRPRKLSALLAAVSVATLCGCGGTDQQTAVTASVSVTSPLTAAPPLVDDPTISGDPIDGGAEVARNPVVSVADGDTITVSIDGVNERIRLIGIDAPELRPAECFGRESADHAAELATGTSVALIADDSQDDRDRYGRLLRYVVLPDGTMLNGVLIRDGYAREFTYGAPYRFQQEFRGYQELARATGTGVWSLSCQQQSAIAATTSTTVGPAPAAPDPNCPIKGNVNSKGDRIYHVPGDDSYPDTVINPAKGERWFCSTAEAEAAGWRAARN